MIVQLNDNDLQDFLVQVGKGGLQLTEFQHSWVLYDSKIQKLIGSITMWFLPMSVLMFLETKGKVNYKYRLLQVLTLNIRT